MTHEELQEEADRATELIKTQPIEIIMLIRTIIVTCCISILNGCAAPIALQLHGMQEAHAPSVEGTSQIYFYRPCVYWGVARGINILRGKENIGGLNCSTYLIYQTTPGVYSFAADDWLRKKTYIELSIEPNRKYYIKTDLHFGLVDVVPYLELTNEQEALKAIEYSRRVKHNTE